MRNSGWNHAIIEEFGEEVRDRVELFLAEYDDEDTAWKHTYELGHEILTLYFETYGD